MYYLNRLLRIDFRRMFVTIRKIARRSGHSFIYIFVDVIICSLLYGAGYMDYFVFFFENLKHEQRKTYITRTVNNNYYKKMNDSRYYHYFHNKIEFLKHFNKYIKRGFFDAGEGSYEEFLDFIKEHPVFMAKPIDGLCGYGIELVDVKGKDPRAIYDEVLRKGQYCLEERIDQDETMSSLYPDSINTMRVVTCNRDGKVTILFVALRIGKGGNVVDNFNSGGIFTVVDEGGYISKPAIDKEGNVYAVHPDTGISIVGFRVPLYDEVIALCKEMAQVIPQVGLTGFDVCISKKGVDVVEGNQLPGYDIYQSAPHLNADLKGLKPRFDEAIYGKRS